MPRDLRGHERVGQRSEANDHFITRSSGCSGALDGLQARFSLS